MTLLRAGVLFMVTAVAEIIGCYLPHLWLRKGKSAFLLLLRGRRHRHGDHRPGT